MEPMFRIARFLGVNGTLDGGKSAGRRYLLPGAGAGRLFGFLHRGRMSSEFLSDVKSPGRPGEILVRRGGGRMLS
ncbi:MAG: hypothetical protein KJ579_09930 [Verrucomicrobia bacterium]|jgi:hypothetical protein|nr:hypothetical protein [Verrucomicrobiota bacterium]